MKNKMLLKTDALVCFVIIVGFLLTAELSYHANYSASIENIEHISALSSDSIYYQIKNIFSKPINVSLTMANDSLLKDFLLQEGSRLEDSEYENTMKEYLKAYQVEYAYDSVFLVSTATSRYYNFNGLDRVLAEGDPENVWYYDGILSSPDDYGMQVDNDEVAGAKNAVTVFVNCKIKDDSGGVLGVVGVGVRFDSMRQMLQDYQNQFNMEAYLIDDEGKIEVSAEHSGYEGIDLFETDLEKAKNRQEILNWKDGASPLGIWNRTKTGQKRTYTIVRYLPELQWHLVVEQNTASLLQRLNRQFVLSVTVIVIILLIVLILITHVIRRFNKQLIQLTRSVEQERQSVFKRATEQLFENIYELDITNNRPANQATEDYFESLGAPTGTSYDDALRIIAEKQIKEEFRQGYLNTFLPEPVMKAYEEGKESLSYEFMISRDGINYYWMRITARIIKSELDQTIHMLVYRQNIDAEKRQEQKLQQLVQTDEMTGLITKMATRRHIEALLNARPNGCFALFIFDIDNFKQANDLHGHAFGDSVIQSFAHTIRSSFRKEDIIGRIGGDEFVAFASMEGHRETEQKAQMLCDALKYVHSCYGKSWQVSGSIGVAFAPEDGTNFDMLYRHADAALYHTKECGRCGYTLYQELKPQNIYREKN